MQKSYSSINSPNEPYKSSPPKTTQVLSIPSLLLGLFIGIVVSLCLPSSQPPALRVSTSPPPKDDPRISFLQSLLSPTTPNAIQTLTDQIRLSPVPEFSYEKAQSQYNASRLAYCLGRSSQMGQVGGEQ